MKPNPRTAAPNIRPISAPVSLNDNCCDFVI